MAVDQTTVLVTGASRGIGRGLVKAYLARPNHTVIAAVRNTRTTKLDIQPASGSKLVLVKIDAKVDSDPVEAVKTVEAAGVTSLDILIANAGIQTPFTKLEGATAKDLREAFDVNAVAPLAVYQAFFPLLQAASENKGVAPKFLAISSNASSTLDVEANTPYMLGTYGASKAALNHAVRRIAFEQKWLTAFLMNPGFVQTDMGNAGAHAFGMEKAFLTIEESVGGITKKLDAATIDTTSGNFYDWDGSELKF